MRQLGANGAAAGAGAPLAPADAHSKRGRARAPAAPSRCPPRRPPRGSAGPGAAGGDAWRGRGLRRPAARRHAGEEPVQPGGRWLRLPSPAAQRGGLPARHPLPGQGEPRPRSPRPGGPPSHRRSEPLAPSRLRGLPPRPLRPRLLRTDLRVPPAGAPGPATSRGACAGHGPGGTAGPMAPCARGRGSPCPLQPGPWHLCSWLCKSPCVSD